MAKSSVVWIQPTFASSAVVEEGLLIGQLGEAKILTAAEDLLLRDQIADILGGQALSGAIGEGDMHLPALEIRQLAEIEVGAEIDLLGILRALLQTAARIAGRLREVVGAQMEALGLQLRSKPAPIAGHVGLLQPIIQGLGLRGTSQEQARDGDRDRGDEACDGSRSAAMPAPCHEGG